jgi:hypothetical protein
MYKWSIVIAVAAVAALMIIHQVGCMIEEYKNKK